MRISFLLLILLTSNLYAQPVPTIEHRVWDKTPINIVLPVGEERRIDFPISINLQLPNHVQQFSKRIQITESGSVYWIATKSFKKVRVNAVTETGYSYILDVEARPNGHKHPIEILDDRIPKKTTGTSQINSSPLDYDYVDLGRFASQSIYAPERLIKPLKGIKRIEVDSSEKNLVKGGDFITEPMAQWMVETIPSLYVTAVRVTSNSLKTEILDPRLIRGDFVAASSQHKHINPAGHDGDTTTWYLISNQPFDEVTQ